MKAKKRKSKKRSKPKQSKQVSQTRIDGDLRQAVAYHQAGRLKEAESLYRQIISNDPRQADAHHLMGVICHQRGQHEEAVRLIKKAISISNQNSMYFNNLGNAYYAIGDVPQAITAYQKALKIKPDDSEIHVNLGNALQKAGASDKAVEHYRHALELKPKDESIWFCLANALMGLGESQRAIDAFGRAIALNPNFAEAYNNLGNALIETGQLETAITSYQNALRQKPGWAEVHYNLADTLEKNGQFPEAQALFERAVELKPDDIVACRKLANYYERTNQLEAARKLVDRGLSQSPNDPMINLVAAKLERREGDTQTAVNRLSNLTDEVSEPLSEAIHFELGHLYDRLKDAQQAMDHFCTANQKAKLRISFSQAEAENYIDKIREVKRCFSPEWVRSWSPASNSEYQNPVFIIGFPRSGTTLLEQILGGHPQIQTLEEKPAVSVVENLAASLEGGYPNGLARLDSDGIERLRSAYFHTVDKYLSRRPGSVLVDKFPLNIIRCGVIHRIFPKARFILALRHPYDVCLSAFMQNFSINEAMAHFFSLKSTARLYREVMELWWTYQNVLTLEVHPLKYENLVLDLESEARRLIAFLGLPWDDRVLEYTRHAQGQQKIQTPSYHQVTEKIYKRARYRWKRYIQWIQSIESDLSPFVTAFKYPGL